VGINEDEDDASNGAENDSLRNPTELSDTEEGFVNDAQLALLESGGSVNDDFNPASLIGRQIAKQFDKFLYVGKIVSFTLPEPDDTPKIAAEGALFRVKFDDGDVEEYNVGEIRQHLIPVGRDYVNLGNGLWNRLKNIYNIISDGVKSGDADAQNVHFIMGLFGLRKPGRVTTANLKSQFKKYCKHFHPDRINHAGQPASVIYVAAQALAGCRFFVEHRAHLLSGALALQLMRQLRLLSPHMGLLSSLHYSVLIVTALPRILLSNRRSRMQMMAKVLIMLGTIMATLMIIPFRQSPLLSIMEILIFRRSLMI